MTDYLVIEDSTLNVLGIGSASGLVVAGQTIRAVADTVTIDRRRVLQGATVTLSNGVVNGITYPTDTSAVDRMISTVRDAVAEVIEINRRIPITNDVSRQAWQATESWAIHLAGAGRLVANNAITNIRLTDNLQQRAITQIAKMPSLTKRWNRVMRRNQANRNAWMDFSYANNASVYVDCLDARGNVRTIDGAYDIILPGGFPDDFDPYIIQ